MGKYEGLEFEIMQVIRAHNDELEKAFDKKLEEINKKIKGLEDSIQYLLKKETETC